mmetsp:Transcript_2020/g.4872  ORF Transcript_2020/g.4872 Transcript_2020/m.4872 type:complete len:241 (-) Transcript_2020:197-919(-)|eukprot:CAMPEP_0117533670 /NCGR_PEP_ID=MMETSP0784-20121206/40012_1 /TAXON_ID=39447 /ORGANISM="" /LENGTH=240 /DNA_ID=CAMNT_0005330119 /DNA_START=105 /DNA_END=827 /DNA_ORIENTATION=+
MHPVQQTPGDRRTRMVTSSVNAGAKKGGAGGSYTWGGIMDVQDYSPVGNLGASKVMVVPQASSMPTPMPAESAAQPMQVSIQDESQFPALTQFGAAATQPAVAWGPGTVEVQQPAAPVMFAQGSARAATVSFDAQHPRNAFARNPRTTTSSVSSDSAQQPMVAIDWSGYGTTGVQQTMLHAAANPQIMGPCVKTQPSVPLQVLRQTVVSKPVIVPKHSNSGYTSKPQLIPRPMVLQARGR